MTDHRPPSNCTWCESWDMKPDIMHPRGAPAFIRWFCACGSSFPDGVLQRHAAKAGAS